MGKRFVPKNVLVVYKKSIYESYFVKKPQWSASQLGGFRRQHLEDFEASHEAHYDALKNVQDTLDEMGIPYCTVDRKRKMNYAAYDFVVTIGGDGTLLHAAGHVGKQIVLGVNSNPKGSVGRFCAATSTNFRSVFEGVLQGKSTIHALNRIEVRLKYQPMKMTVLNDVLVCHQNPATMSHYALCVKKVREYHRSSGIWISTAAGSTGAIQSASGKAMPLTSKKIQYKPRELYWPRPRAYRLQGGVVDGSPGLKIESRMEGGMLYVDGSRAALPFSHGETAEIRNSRHDLRIVDYKGTLSASHLKRRR